MQALKNWKSRMITLTSCRRWMTCKIVRIKFWLRNWRKLKKYLSNMLRNTKKKLSRSIRKSKSILKRSIAKSYNYLPLQPILKILWTSQKYRKKTKAARISTNISNKILKTLWKILSDRFIFTILSWGRIMEI